MAINVQHLPAASQVAGAAYVAGLGRAYQQNANRSADRQFQADQAAIDRATRVGMFREGQAFDADRMRFIADQQAQQAAAEMENRRTLMAEQDQLAAEREQRQYQLEQQGYVQKLTAEQTAKMEELKRAREYVMTSGDLPGVDYRTGKVAPDSPAHKALIDIAGREAGVSERSRWVLEKPDMRNYAAENSIELGNGVTLLRMPDGSYEKIMPPKMTREQQQQQIDATQAAKERELQLREIDTYAKLAALTDDDGRQKFGDEQLQSLFPGLFKSGASAAQQTQTAQQAAPQAPRQRGPGATQAAARLTELRQRLGNDTSQWTGEQRALGAQLYAIAQSDI